MSFSAEQELALRLCGTAERRLEDEPRIAELVRAVDFEELEGVLSWQRLLALCGSRLLESHRDEVPEAFAAAVEAEMADNRRRGLVLDHVTGTTELALERRGIPALVLKGPGLAQRVYGDLGLRSASSDVDLLVRADQLDEAMEVVRAAGYAPYDDVQWAGGLPHYHYGLASNAPVPHRLELHWRVHWYEKRFAADVLARSEQVPGLGRRLRPVDELATLLVIFARDGFLGLRLAADVAAFWDSQRSKIPQGALDDVLAEYPPIRQALLAAIEVCERWVGVPASALRSEKWGRAARTRTAVRLANWTGAGDERDVATNITLIDLLLTPRGAGRTFLRHYYFQPVGHYRMEYGWPAERRVRNQALRLGHAFARLPRSAGKYAQRLWSVRAGRSWVALP